MYVCMYVRGAFRAQKSDIYQDAKRPKLGDKGGTNDKKAADDKKKGAKDDQKKGDKNPKEEEEGGGKKQKKEPKPERYPCHFR